MNTLIRLALMVVLFGAFASASSQVTVDQPPILSVATDLVMLPVSVTDRHGRFVPGLDPDNFTVYDNGLPQAIEFFMSEEIAREIRSGYALGFSPATTRDGGFHWLHVTVTSADNRLLTVRTRAGYYARASDR